MRSQLRADWHRYTVSRDHRRIIDARGRDPQLVGVGVGKRRGYATIFSFDRPRSRSISTERRGRFSSRAGFTPRSSSPWPLPCRALVFTRASSVSGVAVPSLHPELPRCRGFARRARAGPLLRDGQTVAGGPSLAHTARGSPTWAARRSASAPPSAKGLVGTDTGTLGRSGSSGRAAGDEHREP